MEKKKQILNRIKLVITLLLILLGAGMILNPWLRALYFNMMQRSLLNEWESPSQVKSWTESSATISMNSDEFSVWEEDVNPSINVRQLAKDIGGIITIEKVNIKAPIITKHTASNLNISVCEVIPSRAMGQPGNYVLAGHRSRVYGRHFNRINELEAGDIVIVEDRSHRYEYQVEDVFIVSADQVTVMDNDGDRKLITLITCDYTTNPASRLIVRGELTNETVK